MMPRGRIQQVRDAVGIQNQYGTARRDMPHDAEFVEPIFCADEKVSCELLYSPKWDEERKARAAQYIDQWRDVWGGCTGVHYSGSWIRDTNSGDGEDMEDDDDAEGDLAL